MAADPRPVRGLTDVTGLRVGHVTVRRRGWRTGTTVVLAGPDGAVAGVDVRGGGPGTHETDLLRPENLVQRANAICLTGGSAYGLASATGVMLALERAGIGFPVGVGDRAGVVPIVPAAVIYDLARGGSFTARPDASFGERAVAAAHHGQVAEGAVGAGTGAVAGGLQGGVGTAAERLDDGTVVAALAVVNAAGTVIDPSTGLPWELADLGLVRPDRHERAALAAHLVPGRTPVSGSTLNTCIGVVATTAALTTAEATKFASVAHDGLARAVRPAHTLFDGDTVFGLATGAGLGPIDDVAAQRARAVSLSRWFEAGARCFARACTRAVVLAASSPGGAPAYRDLCPTAFRRIAP